MIAIGVVLQTQMRRLREGIRPGVLMTWLINLFTTPTSLEGLEVMIMEVWLICGDKKL